MKLKIKISQEETVKKFHYKTPTTMSTTAEVTETIPVVSEQVIRMRIQKILEGNTRTPAGRFGVKELNESGFLRELFKNFTLTPKE